MNIVLIHFDEPLKKDLLSKVKNPNDPTNYRVNINFTGFNEIETILGFYRNGIFYSNKDFYFRNGIFEMENMLLDDKDELYFVCGINESTVKKYLMVYPIVNFEINNFNEIDFNDDNIDITNNYTIQGIIVNGVLYAFDTIEVINKGLIKFKGFKLDADRDLIKLLILSETSLV